MNSLKESSITGNISLRLPSGNVSYIDANELTIALSKELIDLRSELCAIRSERENELKLNLLTYIQALPEREINRLTSDMSPDVVQAIELLVNAVIDKLGINNLSSEVVIQQSVNHLAQLCMWQLVVGYKLREMEALEKGATIA